MSQPLSDLQALSVIIMQCTQARVELYDAVLTYSAPTLEQCLLPSARKLLRI